MTNYEYNPGDIIKKFGGEIGMILLTAPPGATVLRCQLIGVLIEPYDIIEHWPDSGEFYRTHPMPNTLGVRYFNNRSGGI